MKARHPGEERLLADVVRDDTYATRDAVKVRCVEEMRARREAETRLGMDLIGRGAAAEARCPPARSPNNPPGGRRAPAAATPEQGYPAFLESVRLKSLSALRHRRGLPRWFRQAAAAAAVVVLVGASALLWWSSDSAQTPALAHEETSREAHPDVARNSDPVVPPDDRTGSYIDPRAYRVASRAVPGDVIVRTADHESMVEIIGDDELLEAIPGLAITRVGSPGDDRMVFVNGPSLGQAVRVN